MTSVDPATASHKALWDMALIHRIFRTSFAELVRIVPAVPSADTARIEAVVAHLRFLIDGLNAHHMTEDEHVWPALHERAQPSTALVGRMEVQHQVIHDALDDVHRLAATWSAQPSPAAGSALTAGLTHLLEVLTEHLDEEERLVVPIIAEHITEGEWETAGRAAFDKFTPAQRFIATGQMLEVATPAESAAMMGGLPPPVKILWALVGKRRYRRYAAAYRGAQGRVGA